VRDLEIGFA